MEVYHLRVKNLNFKEGVENIVKELRKLYAVIFVDVNLENSEIKVVLGELGSIMACQTVLQTLGYPVIQIF